jgi:hypothetical protein
MQASSVSLENDKRESTALTTLTPVLTLLRFYDECGEFRAVDLGAQVPRKVRILFGVVPRYIIYSGDYLASRPGIIDNKSPSWAAPYCSAALPTILARIFRKWLLQEHGRA